MAGEFDPGVCVEVLVAAADAEDAKERMVEAGRRLKRDGLNALTPDEAQKAVMEHGEAQMRFARLAERL